MGGQEDRFAQVLEPLDDLPCVAPRAWVEPRGGFVEEQDARVARERDGHVEPPPLPTRKLRDARVLLVCQADQADHLVQRSGFRVVAAKHLDRLGDRQVGIDSTGLQHDAHLLLEPAVPQGWIKAKDRNLATVAAAKSFENLDRRRLACAVRAEEGEDFTFRDGKADSAEGLQRAVGLPEVEDLNRNIRHVASMLAQPQPTHRVASTSTSKHLRHLALNSSCV